MPKIAVVDDDETLREALRAMLQSQGYAVVTYPDAHSALDAMVVERPALALLDVNLPDMDGPELCRALKAVPALRRMIVLMMTGEAVEVAQRVAGLDSGADDYLLKPIGPKVLLSRVKALLQAAEARS